MGRDSVTDSSFLDTRNHTNITSAEQKWSFEFTVTLTTILALVDLCIIVGNCMVLLVIVRHRGMRTRTNLFLVNLAVADLLVGLCVVPFTVTTLMENRWIFGNGAVCMFNGWMNSFCLISSIHTLMYISIHKYFSIVRPLSNPLKLSYIIGMMAAAWLWAAICSTMNVTGLIVEHKPGTSQCGPRYPNDLQMFIIHAIIQITCIVIPFLILVFCYIRMFQEIKRHSQRMRTNSTVAEDLILSQQKKVAVTLLIVLATFVVMALPYFAYANYTTVVKDKKHFSIYLNPVAYTFLFMSSMCNPIIYAFRSPAFREGYKEILCQTPNYVISDGPMGTIKCTTRKAGNGYFHPYSGHPIYRTGQLARYLSASADQLYVRRAKERQVNQASRRISVSADHLPLPTDADDRSEMGKPKNVRFTQSDEELHRQSELRL
ncbi:beta-1 adrenergic receptor-like isoform X2 [Biomphalaria glabrata]|uniref:Beta-1 adrenergic receptor-like isoform X2 n=1 Tax=Biomphalaria glabrata TaxID=6526 RepID=A0A9W2YL16_BIOGL|nr:beta-1 adrenergic receptor-like isoform X2 [Biomphalaria glabrata]